MHCQVHSSNSAIQNYYNSYYSYYLQQWKYQQQRYQYQLWLMQMKQRYPSLNTQASSSTSTSTSTSNSNSPQRGSSNQPENQFQDECYKFHNQFRRENGAPLLLWDNNLVLESMKWAKELVKIGKLQHSTGGKYGENLYMTWNGDKSCSAAIKNWNDEKKFYAPGQKIGQGDFHKYGHYTQLIWRNTKKVGCSYADSSDGASRYTVCKYDPPGNVIGVAAY